MARSTQKKELNLYGKPFWILSSILIIALLALLIIPNPTHLLKTNVVLDGNENANTANGDDLDRDGILNAADNCPEVAGTSENFGCPFGQTTDQDGDGITNILDNCPYLAGATNEYGCPINIADYPSGLSSESMMATTDDPNAIQITQKKELTGLIRSGFGGPNYGLSNVTIDAGGLVLVAENECTSPGAVCTATNCECPNAAIHGNKSGPRWFDLSNPLAPARNPDRSWDVNTTDHVAGDFGPEWKTLYGVYSTKDDYALQGSDRSMAEAPWLIRWSDRKMMWSGLNHPLGIIATANNTFVLSENGLANLTGVQEYILNGTPMAKYQPLPSNAPHPKFGQKKIFGTQFVSLELGTDPMNPRSGVNDPKLVLYDVSQSDPLKTIPLASLLSQPGVFGLSTSLAAMDTPAGKFVFVIASTSTSTSTFVNDSTSYINVYKIENNTLVPYAENLFVAENNVALIPIYVHEKIGFLGLAMTNPSTPQAYTNVTAYSIDQNQTGTLTDHFFGTSHLPIMELRSYATYIKDGTTYVYLVTPDSNNYNRLWVWKF